MDYKTYILKAPTPLWEEFKSVIPRSKINQENKFEEITINDIFLEMMNERIEKSKKGRKS